jgi:hypothetical protein
MRTGVRCFLLVTALALAAGCGGDDDDGGSASASVRGALIRQLEGEGFSRPTSECAADAFIEVVPEEEAERSAADPDYVLPDPILAEASGHVLTECPEVMEEGIETGIFDPTEEEGE